MPKKNLSDMAEDLEDMAIHTLIDVMGNSTNSPQDRLAAAKQAMTALGKAEPPKAMPGQVVFNFGNHLGAALLGLGTTLQLTKDAPDQETTPSKVKK